MHINFNPPFPFALRKLKQQGQIPNHFQQVEEALRRSCGMWHRSVCKIVQNPVSSWSFATRCMYCLHLCNMYIGSKEPRGAFLRHQVALYFIASILSRCHTSRHITIHEGLQIDHDRSAFSIQNEVTLGQDGPRSFPHFE